MNPQRQEVRVTKSMNAPMGMGWFEWDEEVDRVDLSDRSFPPLGPYDNREVVSALRKSIKMGRTEDAIWWLTVALDLGKGGTAKYLARQLWIVAAEDLFDPMIVIQAGIVYQMTGICQETDHLYQLVYRMTKCEKMHEEDGAELDRIWGEAEGHMLNGRWREVPTYAVDRHTYRGKQMIGNDQRTDERFSGTTFGRLATRWIWTVHGWLDPDAELTGAFWQFWNARKASYGVGKRWKIRKTVAEKKAAERAQGELL